MAANSSNVDDLRIEVDALNSKLGNQDNVIANQSSTIIQQQQAIVKLTTRLDNQTSVVLNLTNSTPTCPCDSSILDLNSRIDQVNSIIYSLVSNGVCSATNHTVHPTPTKPTFKNATCADLHPTSGLGQADCDVTIPGGPWVVIQVRRNNRCSFTFLLQILC